MEHQIFISYTQPDRNVAFIIHDALVTEGLTAWVASSITDGVVSGSAYKSDIAKAIKECKIFILLYSKYVNNSRDVKNELSLAEKKVIIPIRLDISEMSDDLKYDLKGLEYIDAIDRDFVYVTSRLVHDIKKHLKYYVAAETLSTDMVMLRKGIKVLNAKKYYEARQILSQYIEIAPSDLEARYYLALSFIAGTRPQKLDGILVNKIEEILYPAIETNSCQHARYLLALVKYGYYSMNSLREKIITWSDLIKDMRLNEEKAKEIIYHINDPSNVVWKLIVQISNIH